MVQIHATWLPTADPYEYSAFFLWARRTGGESSERSTEREEKAGRSDFSVSYSILGIESLEEHLLRSPCLERRLGSKTPLAREELRRRFQLWLPDPRGGMSYARVEVPGIVFRDAEWVTMLQEIAVAGDAGREALGPAPDFRFWISVARWAWELAARGRVIPDVVPVHLLGPTPYGKSVWRLVPTPGYEEDVAAWAKAIPGSALAAHSAPGVAFTGEAAVALSNFLAALMHHSVRVWIGRIPGHYYGHGRIMKRWLWAMRSEDPKFNISEPVLRRFVDCVRAWHEEGIAASYERSPAVEWAWDVVLQLAPVTRRGETPAPPWEEADTEKAVLQGAPPAREVGDDTGVVFAEAAAAHGGNEAAASSRAFPARNAAEGEADASGAPARLQVADGWVLRYWLRSRHDAGAYTAAEELWRAEPGAEVAAARATLLRGLAALAAEIGAIRRSLAEEAPAGCRLTDAEAMRLLTIADTEQERWRSRGIILHVPRWLQEVAAPLRVTYTLSRLPERSRHLGFDTLFDFHWQVALGDTRIDTETFRRLVDSRLPVVRIHGRWVQLQPEQAARLRVLWMNVIRHDPSGETSGSVRLTLGELASELAKDGDPAAKTDVFVPQPAKDADVGVADRLRRFIDLFQGEHAGQERPVPRGLQARLRPYQVRGYSWMASMTDMGFGVCLADDMGLGKTVQVIALLQRWKEEGAPGPGLIICPAGVLDNWRRELARFAPGIRCYLHHGDGRMRGDALRQAVASHDAVLTSYRLIVQDEEELGDLAWQWVVVDEAQALKNAEAKQTRAVRRLRAARRIALTGTPIENRLSELWSIMDFLNPGYLGSREQFQEAFAKPIEDWGDTGALDCLRALVRPFILRRLKSDPAVVPELPAKEETRIDCRLTPEQAALYQSVLGDMMEQIEASAGLQRRGLVFALLTRLKQICDHPALFLKDGDVRPERSGKLLELLVRIRRVWEQGERALIFTQYVGMGRLLQTAMQEATGEEVGFLHGGLSRARRDELVQTFQRGDAPPLLILSLRAGGVGLNLTRATHVFHYDRWWNPAVERQATDRAYRIGQTSNVTAYKLVCVGTLEERIDEMIAEKQALADDVIDAGEKWLTELGNDDLRRILMLREGWVRA